MWPWTSLMTSLLSLKEDGNTLSGSHGVVCAQCLAPRRLSAHVGSPLSEIRWLVQGFQELASDRREWNLHQLCFKFSPGDNFPLGEMARSSIRLALLPGRWLRPPTTITQRQSQGPYVLGKSPRKGEERNREKMRRNRRTSWAGTENVKPRDSVRKTASQPGREWEAELAEKGRRPEATAPGSGPGRFAVRPWAGSPLWVQISHL